LRIAREQLTSQLREVEKLKAGHVDRFAETRKRPIDELVREFKAHLTAEGRALRYIEDTVQQLRSLIRFARVATLPGILMCDALRFLEEISKTRSVKTRDNYAGAFHSFGNWLRNSGRWDCDPFHGIRTCTATKDKHRVFKRVGLRFEEAQRLVEAAMARYEAEKAKGGTATHVGNEAEGIRDRQVLYCLL
jgi:hypothetical protein